MASRNSINLEFNTGDIRSRIFYKKLIQVDGYNFLQCVSCFLAHVFTMQLYSVEETCMCVNKIARFELVGCVLAGIVLSYLLTAMFVVQVSCTIFLSMCQGITPYDTS